MLWLKTVLWATQSLSEPIQSVTQRSDAVCEFQLYFKNYHVFLAIVSKIICCPGDKIKVTSSWMYIWWVSKLCLFFPIILSFWKKIIFSLPQLKNNINNEKECINYENCLFMEFLQLRLTSAIMFLLANDCGFLIDSLTE